MIHKEYIQDVQGSSAFRLTELPLNPGLPSSFPWLSQMADAYEEYRIKGMVFEFKSTSSEFVLNSGGAGGSSGALGTVIMATNYNAAIHPPFNDKKSMENYEHAQSAPPTKSMIHAIESKGAATVLKTLYLRTGPSPDGTDIRMYDIGNFCIATQGMITEVNNATIGELWVAYEVEFFKPRYRVSGGKTDHYSLRYDATSAPSSNLVGGMTATNPFGTAPRIDRENPARGPNNLNNGVFHAGSYITNVTGVSSILHLPKNPAGMYKVTIILRGAANGELNAAGDIPVWVTTPNATAVLIGNWYNNWTSQTVNAPSGPTTTPPDRFSNQWVLQQLYKVLPFDTTTEPTVTYAISIPPSIAQYAMDIFVEEVNPEYYINPSI